MAKLEKQGVGRLGENYSARYLQSKGYTIVARNVHVSKNEIDIIAEKDGILSFTEVKTRTFSSRYSAPFETARPANAVTFKKRLNVINAAKGYISENNIEQRCRFDVIEIYFSVLPDGMYKFYKINHIEGAFDEYGNIT